jgi:hypothetical protein
MKEQPAMTEPKARESKDQEAPAGLDRADGGPGEDVHPATLHLDLLFRYSTGCGDRLETHGCHLGRFHRQREPADRGFLKAADVSSGAVLETVTRVAIPIRHQPVFATCDD